METATTIFDFSVKIGVIGLLVIFSGWLIVILLNGFKKGPFDIRKAGLATRVGFAIAALGIGAVVMAVFGVMASGVVWGWHVISSLLSPGSLALYSVAIGVSPMILSVLGVGLAKLLGGSVDARGPQNCSVKGVELGGLVYTLFMSYWLMFFTAGVMVLGLIASSIWAVL